MENEIEKKIKDLKEFIKLKTDQGTANYLGKEFFWFFCCVIASYIEFYFFH